ncbi:MAG: hypothetical protein AAF571_10320 [Verrucomicrobiota bacterium]
MRTIIILVISWLSVCAVQAANERIFISGGPSLRVFERHKPAPHDRFWGNFITSGVARYQEIKGNIGEDSFTWLIHRPGYERRGEEIGYDLIQEIKNMVEPTGAKIIWFHTRDELVDYLNTGNNRSKTKISHLEYFGHSNRLNWCFDYSNQLDGMVQENMCLHIRHLSQIKKGLFTKKAFTKSWGCHSGESYSEAWHRATGARMWGAIGKTNYASGGVPKLSTSAGEWVQ